jgi:hypothetical protein
MAKSTTRVSTLNLESKEPSTPCFIPWEYNVPTRPIAKALEALEDSEKPGLIPEETLRIIATRFCEAFGGGAFGGISKDKKASERLEGALTLLRERTSKRWGAEVVDSGMLDWQHNKRTVFSMFMARLNIFERIFFTVDVGESESKTSHMISMFLIFTIVLSILLWMMSTLPECQEVCSPVVITHPNCTFVSNEEEICAPWTSLGGCEEAPRPTRFFRVMEILCIWIFTIEYLLRTGSAHSVRFELLDEDFIEKFLKSEVHTVPQLDNQLKTILKFIFRPASLVDLLSILPFWVEKIAGSSGGNVFLILRILRLTRIFRVFKLGKYNEIFSLFGYVVRESMPALYLMLFFIIIGMCLFGSLIWMTEQGTWYPPNHPENLALGIEGRGAYLLDVSLIEAYESLDETPFASIIHSFWFVIVTITTAGYGDLYPQSPMGKLVGAIMILSGIIVLAMPVGVIGSNFSSEYDRMQAAAAKRRKLLLQREIEQELLKKTKQQQQAEHRKVQAWADEAEAKAEEAKAEEDSDEEEEVKLSKNVQAMNALLDRASTLENELCELLPEEAKLQVQNELRAYLGQVVAAQTSQNELSMKDLHSGLDDLVFGVLGHLRSILSHQPGAVPTPGDILTCRRKLLELAAEIENWWVDHPVHGCRSLETHRPPTVSPARDLLEMKAHLGLT